MSTVYKEFTYGDIASLRGNSNLIVTSPKGIVTSFPASIHRVQRFRVEELGTWKYEWGDGMRGEFIVVPSPTQLEPPNPPVSVVRESPRLPAHTAGEKFFSFF